MENFDQCHGAIDSAKTSPPNPLLPHNPAGKTETAVMCRPLRDWLFKPGGAEAEPVRIGIHDDP